MTISKNDAIAHKANSSAAAFTALLNARMRLSRHYPALSEQLEMKRQYSILFQSFMVMNFHHNLWTACIIFIRYNLHLYRFLMIDDVSGGRFRLRLAKLA